MRSGARTSGLTFWAVDMEGPFRPWEVLPSSLRRGGKNTSEGTRDWRWKGSRPRTRRRATERALGDVGATTPLAGAEGSSVGPRVSG